MRISDWSSDVCSSDLTLTYSFVESLVATYPYYLGRFFGGVLILAGMVLMAWHMWRTWQEARAVAANPVLAPDGAEAARGRDMGIDRKSVGTGKSVSIRVNLGCARSIKKKNKSNTI